MKKSHEYDSPVLSRLVSVVSVFAICVCSVCCIVTASKISTITTAAPAASNGGSIGGSTGGSAGGSTGGSAGGSTDSSNAATGGSDAPAAGDAASTQEILDTYTQVMDKFKAEVATYEKKEFQKLADDYDLGTIGNMVLPIAEGLMTSEEKAEIQQRDDPEQIPVIRNTKGCLLTDISAIKSATKTEEGGKTTIVIVLNDEDNPEPTPENGTPVSKTGAMFNPLSKTDVDNIVAKFSSVADIKNFNLCYKDCTATLVYDTETQKVESLNQIMNVYITVDAKVVLLSLSGYATLINNMTINNVQYK